MDFSETLSSSLSLSLFFCLSIRFIDKDLQRITMVDHLFGFPYRDLKGSLEMETSRFFSVSFMSVNKILVSSRVFFDSLSITVSSFLDLIHLQKFRR